MKPRQSAASPPAADEIYSAREIARAAEVSEEYAIAAIGGAHAYLGHSEAVHVGRALRRGDWVVAGNDGPKLLRPETLDASLSPTTRVPLAVSSTVHAGLVAVVLFITSFGLASTATESNMNEHAEPMRLVFMTTPGPGGGGGGGGLRQKPAPPKAMREGRRAASSPLPVREPPKPIAPEPSPPEPKPVPLDAERLPAIVAPIVTSPSDPQNRVGILEQSQAQSESHGPGQGGGVGSGAGSGIGQGDGSGIGPGSGGGIGGGPYRPGSAIEPPRVLREIKADYTEDARRRQIVGDVVMEIVVRSDGTVGDVRVLQGLGGGLNERAVQAVRQWRFSPARRLGSPVDVLVEVALEFRLR